MDKNVINIYSDGGARGNPGPAGSAFVVLDNDKIIHKDSAFFKIKTNNEAEYEALLMALRWLSKNNKLIGTRNIYCHLDSELIVKQLNGEYRIKSNNLKPLAIEVRALEKKIVGNVKYIFVRRENNKLADQLVNEIMDEKLTENN